MGGVRSHPQYIRGPRPSEGTPPAQEFALEEVVGRGGVGVEARFESGFFCIFSGLAAEPGRRAEFKDLKKRRSSSCSQGPFHFAFVRCPGASLPGPHTGSQTVCGYSGAIPFPFSVTQSRPRMQQPRARRSPCVRRRLCAAQLTRGRKGPRSAQRRPEGQPVIAVTWPELP